MLEALSCLDGHDEQESAGQKKPRRPIARRHRSSCGGWYTRKMPSALRIPAQSDGCAGGRTRDDTSTGETVVRLLDFIRTRRSQRHQALPPAPAEVEEALPNERDINTRLREEIAAARQAEDGPWPSVKQANREAAHAFTPVREAAQQLAHELAGNEHITWTLRANDLTLTLGQERRVSASRQGWQRDFAVADTIACPDLRASVERTYTFQTADDVITFLIKACAEFLAQQP
jgi:hypothetical protein